MMHKDIIDSGFLDFIKNNTHELNPSLANGLAYTHGKYIEEYIESVFMAVIKGIPDFKYLRSEKVSPVEEYQEITKEKESKRIYDLSRSDTYMRRYIFEFKGDEYSRLISLPFISEGGTIFIKGTQYTISPVLADVVIEVTPPNLFVRLLRDRLTFTRSPYNFTVNNGVRFINNDKVLYNIVRETIPVVKSNIYNQTSEMRNRKKVYNLDTNLVFYLLCKYGATEMFRRFTNTNVMFVNDDDPILRTINEDEWVICKTIGKQPATLNKAYYKQTPIVILMPREKYTNVNKSLIAGMFYVLDHFSEEIALDELDTVVKWRVCMGMKLWGHEPNAGKLLADLTAHIDSLDNYIEIITHKKFLNIGLDIKDIYQLFFIIIEKYDQWQTEHINNESNLYGKELSVLYYFLSDLTIQIVKFYFKMMKDSKKGLTSNDVISNMNRDLKTNIILGVYKGHGEMSVVNSSCDNMIYKLTQLLVPQDKTARKRNNANTRVNLNSYSMRLNASLAEVCNYSGMTKASPDSRTRINLHIKIDEDTGKIVRSEELKAIIDEVQEKLSAGRVATGQK